MPSTAARSCRTRLPWRGLGTWRGLGASRLLGTCASGRTRRTDSVMSSGMVRRLAMSARMMIVPTRWGRRRERRGTPRVDDHVLHDDRLLRRLDARAVAMRAHGRPVGMGDDLRAVADRAERTVNVTAVHPCSGRYAASRERYRRRRENRQIVLVHDPPHFPFTESKANKAFKSDR